MISRNGDNFTRFQNPAENITITIPLVGSANQLIAIIASMKSVLPRGGKTVNIITVKT